MGEPRGDAGRGIGLDASELVAAVDDAGMAMGEEGTKSPLLLPLLLLLLLSLLRAGTAAVAGMDSGDELRKLETDLDFGAGKA